MNDITAEYGDGQSATTGRDEYNRSLLRAIKEASPDGILVVDENAVVIEFNQKFVDIWRLPGERLQLDQKSRREIPDYPVLMTVTQRVKDPEAFLARIRHLYEHPGESDHTEIDLKDGRTIERDSVCLWGDGHEYLGRIWFFRDITERKAAAAQLQYLAWRDPLTDLPNRRHFFDRAAQEMDRAKRHRHPLSLVMFDLDHFKRVNDRYGHGAGDRVLEEVCRRCRESLRHEDIPARIGGEEFAVLLPNTTADSALIIAERLRLSVAGTAVSTESDEISCSISLGVTAVRESDRRIEDALARADEALYEAKASGRNRVILHRKGR